MSVRQPLAQHGPELLHQQQEVARLQGLLDASRRIHGTIKLDEVLHSTLELTVKELEAEGAFFTRTDKLASAALLTYGHIPNDSPSTNDPQILQGFPHFALRDKQGCFLSWLVVIRPELPLSVEEEDFVEGLALQSSVAIENAYHHELLIMWERLKQDLASARLVQQGLLPKTLPHLPGYRVVHQFTPCHEIGGDYIDIIPISHESFVMIVADVAGKGLASALVSASFRAAFRAMVASGLGLEEIAARMNDLHYAEGEQARLKYVTAIIGQLDTRRHALQVVNAGHTSGLLLGDCENCLLESTGPPLGLFPGMQYHAENYSLSNGCGVLFYTDGLTEAQCPTCEEFGLDRLINEFRDLQSEHCDNPLDRLWARISAFSGREPQSDDMTAIALFRNAAAGRAA